MQDDGLRMMTREQQQEAREAVREPRCDTLEELRVTYVALARRWRAYAVAQPRLR